MRYTDSDDHIKEVILTWTKETGQHELFYLIPYLIGYYGEITDQIWLVIRDMILEDAVIRK